MVTVLLKPSTDNESVDTNAGTNDGISQDVGAEDCMDLSSEEESNISDSETSSLEDIGTQIPSEFQKWVKIPSKFYEGVGDIG